MFHLNENYYLRKHFLKNNAVPTQSLMKKKMTPSLAAVYFKSMSPKLKVMAGLEPPLKGGGGDWYVAPKDLLEGKSILKPVSKRYLSRLNYLGIDTIGMKMLEMRLNRMQRERNKLVLESDEKWKSLIESECRQFYQESSKEAAKKNTERIQNALNEFTTIYSSSMNTIENVLFDAARTEIINIRDMAYKTMKDKFDMLVKQQASELYDVYTSKMMTEKERLKAEFLTKLEETRSETGYNLHDQNVQKHAAVEKLRTYLECQNLACQVYVALKERELCRKELDLLEHEHRKKVKVLKDDIILQDYEIILQIEKEKKRQEFNAIWMNKIRHVVEKFQMFVSYSLNLLPEHAEFFLNMEKLMLLHLNETIENPTVESIFIQEEGRYEGPAPQPNPFFLFCDQGNKYKIPLENDLCPKKWYSNASQMPVIIVNKRCIYAACDNFAQFTNKIKFYIHGKRGDDADFRDDHPYHHDVPVRYTDSQQLLELKLESSLLQVLQQEIANLKEVPIECGVCKMPHCFCCYSSASKMALNIQKEELQSPKTSSQEIHFNKKLKTRYEELLHEREPKWESYLRYVEPKKCACKKISKKHLAEHLPVYMRTMSAYEAPQLLNYEICSVTDLKHMVKEAKGYHTPPPLPVIASKTRDVSTQYSDQLFDFLCNCFSGDDIQTLFKDKITGSKMLDASITEHRLDVVESSLSTAYLLQRPASFAIEQAQSLRNLIDWAPELEEIFMHTGRSFDYNKFL